MKIGIFGATFLVLLALKLTGTIDWSWWLVTAPLTASALLAVGAIAVYAWLNS